jgi:hypothetical protein
MISPFFILLVTALISAICWLVAHKGWTHAGRCSKCNEGFLPRSAPSASRTARIVEATLIGAAAIVIIAFFATWPTYGGYLLMLGQLQHECAHLQLIKLACVVAGACIAIIFALFGRTFVGTITLAIALIGYVYYLNGNHNSSPEMIAKPTVQYTVDLSPHFSPPL